MAEDHGGFQAAEGHRLCANNCGFFGSPATLNLCSKCFTSKNPTQSAVPSVATAHPPSIPPPPKGVFSTAAIELNSVQTVPKPNRCFTCRKRVGLTGFKCRCGVTCCGDHRYPEGHGCNYDYKAAGKEAIARENPVVKAEKLDKI